MILFSKFSNERDPRFQIRTDIVEENGKRIVRKCPAAAAARGHILHIADSCAAFGRLTEGTRFRMNRCSSRTETADRGYAELEYLTGETLEERIDRNLAGDPAQVCADVAAYLAEIDRMSDGVFQPCAEFEEVFGDVKLPEDLPSVSVSDIDLVLNNIVVTGDVWNVLDYEWTFFFPAPTAYLKWRVVHYYVNGNSKRQFLDRTAMLRDAGISSALDDAFSRMEVHFQQYVAGSLIPRRDLYDEVSPGAVFLSELTGNPGGTWGRTPVLSVYREKDGTFTENEKTEIRADEDGYAEIRLSVEGTPSFRFDPTEMPVYVEIVCLAADSREIPVENLKMNGMAVNSTHLIFLKPDPWFILSGWPLGTKSLTAAVRMHPLEERAARQFLLPVTELAEEVKKGRAREQVRDDLLRQRRSLAGNIRSIRSEKLLMKASVMRGHGDPFAEFRPWIANDPEGLSCHIDQVTGMRDGWFVRGWCYDRAFGIETIIPEDSSHIPYETEVKRSYRDDVSEEFGLDPMVKYGFSFKVPESAETRGLFLVIEDLRGRLRLNIPITRETGEETASGITDAAYRDWLSRHDPGKFAAAEPSEEAGGIRFIAVTPGDAIPPGDGKDWILFADSHTRLSGDALGRAAERISSDPGTDFLYTDSDFLYGDGEIGSPLFKPDWNPGLLGSWNYIGLPFLVKRKTAEAAYSDLKFPDGRNMRDIPGNAWQTALAASRHAEKIVHIPEILARNTERADDGRRVFPEACRIPTESDALHVREYYERKGIRARVSLSAGDQVLRTDFSGFPEKQPLVSVIIPNKDHLSDLRKCVFSLNSRSVFRNLEYIIIENNSTEPETFSGYEELKRRIPSLRVVTWKGDFDYAAINRFGAEQAKGGYLLFLNNDTEMIEPLSVGRMLADAMQSDIGAVGARLYYPDNTVQHAGVIIGSGGTAGHAFVGAPADDRGYMKRIVSQQDLSAVTAACMMVPKELFFRVGAFTKELRVAFNDTDLCLKIREAGYRVFYEPGAVFYHDESKSRGYEDSPVKKVRFAGEIGYFRKRWADILKNGDPAYNPNLTLRTQDFRLASEEEREETQRKRDGNEQRFSRKK